MLLAIDIGNTNVVLGIFDGKTLVANWRVGTNTQITPDEYAMIFSDLFGFAKLDFNRITGVIISTVVPPLLPVMSEMSRKYFHIEPTIVTHELKTGITIRYDNPKEIGADRIVNAAAAYKLFGGPIIIVELWHGHDILRRDEERGVPGRCNLPGDKNIRRGVVPACVEAPARGAVKAREGNRRRYDQRHAVGHHLWLCRAGGRHC